MRRTQTYKYHTLVSSGALYKRRRFRSFVITKSVLVTTACAISVIIFLFTALTVFKGISFPEEIQF